MDYFDHSIDFKYRSGTDKDPLKDITETRTIINGRIQLTEIPNYKSHVYISPDFVEIYTPVIKKPNQYYVDYKNGIVYFHQGKSGQQVTLTYKGRGAVFVSAGRVWTKKDESGDINQTLQDIIDLGEEAIDNLETLNEAINNANNAVENANSAIENINQIADVVNNKELQRIEAENYRISAENIRQTKEIERIVNEEERQLNEEERISSESIRKDNEINRENAEVVRISNESERIEAENIRQQNELDRISRDYAFQVCTPYSEKIEYVPLNKVVYQGSTYQNIKSCKGIEPINTEYWILIAAKGEKGNTGEKGDKGDKGDTGVVPKIKIGDVATLPAGSGATVVRRDDSPDTEPIFDFGIPKGYDGTGTLVEKSNINGNIIINNEETNVYTHPTGDGNLHVPATGINNNNKVLKTGSAEGSLSWGNVDWNEIKNVPSIYPPSPHTHGGTDITTAVAEAVNADTLDGKHYSDIKSEIQTVQNNFNTHLNNYADLKGYIGYTEDDIYGVEVDFINRKFTRLAGAVGKTPGADFDSILAFGGRRRCNLTDDGKVLAYYGEPGYSETGATIFEIIKNSVTYPVGTKVQCMVEQPKFYYKVVPLKLEKIQDGKGYHMRKARYYVSDTPKVGFKVHPAFVRNGVEVDKIYLSAYEGSIYDESPGIYLVADEQIADFNEDKLSSIPYARPASGLTQNLTRANIRKLAENRGAGWQQKDVLCASASQMLMMIEYAAFNMQSAIGSGVVNKPSGTGNESELTGATSHLGNASGMMEGTNGLVSISYRGEENFWGNIWAWVDGLNVYINPDTRKTDAYWAAEDFSDDTGSAPYKHVGFNLTPNTDGYISAFGWSEECDFLFLPTETLGNSALPVGDRFYNLQTGWRGALLGGSWDNGLSAGAFNWSMSATSVLRARNFGGRLLYVPQAP